MSRVPTAAPNALRYAWTAADKLRESPQGAKRGWSARISKHARGAFMRVRESAPTLATWALRCALAVGALAVLIAIGQAAARTVGTARAAPALGAIGASAAAVAALDNSAVGAESHSEDTNAPYTQLGIAANVLVMPAMTIEATPPHAERASAEHPVFVNEATLEELERLPGVGPKKAAGILQLRTRLGRFHRVEDLLRVKGIGPKALAKIRPLVRLEAATATAARDAGAD